MAGTGSSDSARADERPLLYCLLPRDLAPRLHDLLRRHFRDDPAVEVVVEARTAPRRSHPDRRTADPDAPVPAAGDRRVVRSVTGRRIAERRASLIEVPARELPRRAQGVAARVLFVERFEPNTQELEDIDSTRLVSRIQSGDADLFTVLYMRYFDRVYGYLRVLLRDEHDAEDTVQGVFVSVLEALPRYSYREIPFRVWLFTVARNHALTRLKRGGRSELADVEAILRDRPAPPEPTGLQALNWISDRDLQLFISRLPLAQRQVLFLRYLVGLSTNEVAAICGQSPETVRKQHTRALGFLRDRLTALGRDPKRSNRVGSRVIVRQANVLRLRRFALIPR